MYHITIKNLKNNTMVVDTETSLIMGVIRNDAEDGTSSIIAIDADGEAILYGLKTLDKVKSSVISTILGMGGD